MREPIPHTVLDKLDTTNRQHSTRQVNCDANEDLCDQDRWDIEGLPAVKVMRGGEGGPVHDYNGPRTAADIAAFMRQVGCGCGCCCGCT